MVSAVIALRPGTEIDAAIRQLRLTAQDAANKAGATSGQYPLHDVEQYLRWAEDAERMLSNVLDLLLVDDLIRTPGYWTLRASRGDEPRLTSAVLGEMRQRQAKLDALADELQAEHRRWSDGLATLVVPDTNMFLQDGAPLQDIDWPSAIGSDTDIRLVVPLIVVHELDRLKRQGNSATAKLARASLRLLLDVLPRAPQKRSEPLHAGRPVTTIESYVHDGPSRPDDADGLIIRVTRWLATVSGRPTMLVTRDLGMRLRAAAAGVTARQLVDP